MTLLWGTCRSWSCCFLSLWHRGGRKHSLICNPISLGASPVQGADKTAGTVRHWDSPEFSSDAGQEASPPPKYSLKAPQGTTGSWHKASWKMLSFLELFLPPRNGGQETQQPITGLGAEEIKKGEEEKKKKRDPVLLLPLCTLQGGIGWRCPMPGSTGWCLGSSLISSISPQVEAVQVTLSPIEPLSGWLGDSPGRSWVS